MDIQKKALGGPAGPQNQ